jgi:hypothetical protein
MEVAMSSITKDGYTYTRNNKGTDGWKFAEEDEDMEYDDDDMEYEYDEDEDMNNIKLKCTK